MPRATLRAERALRFEGRPMPSTNSDRFRRFATPAENEVRAVLARLEDAKARLRDLQQIRLIHSWLAQSARSTGGSAVDARRPDAMRSQRSDAAR